MENLLNKYKFFISCSKFEGNPKSVLEAMGAGCIVFVSSNKNTQEIITNNKNGFLFDLESDNFIELFNSTISRLDLENISNFASSYIKQSNSLDTLVQRVRGHSNTNELIFFFLLRQDEFLFLSRNQKFLCYVLS